MKRAIIIMLLAAVLLPIAVYADDAYEKTKLDQDLHEAALDGDLGKLQECLDKGADINSRNTYDGTILSGPYLDTPLCEACRNGHTEVAKYLLKHGARVRVYNVKHSLWGGKNYDSALIHAVRSGKLEIVKLLFDYGVKIADPEGKKYDDSKCLLYSTGPEGEDIIFVMIDKGADLAAHTTELLHQAAAKNYYRVLDMLISNGVDINTADKDGDTIFMKAAYEGNIMMASYLLYRGADPDIVNNNGFSALSDACMRLNLEVMEFLLSNGADTETGIQASMFSTPTAISYIGFHDAEKAFKALVLMDEYGADLTSKDIYGNSLLSDYYNNPDAIKFLIDKGLEVNKKNNSGDTSLFQAAVGGNIKVINLLLKNKADVQVINKYGRNCLFSACGSGRTAAAALLIKKGAQVNLRDEKGVTQLMLASYRGDPELINLLLDKGAYPSRISGTDPDKPKKKLHDFDSYSFFVRETVRRNMMTADDNWEYGLNALAYAVISGKAGNVEALINGGADPAFAIQGVFPVLSLAAAHGDLEVVKVLLKYGADPARKDGLGMPAYDWAGKIRDKKTADYLKTLK